MFIRTSIKGIVLIKFSLCCCVLFFVYHLRVCVLKDKIMFYSLKNACIIYAFSVYLLCFSLISYSLCLCYEMLEMNGTVVSNLQN